MKQRPKTQHSSRKPLPTDCRVCLVMHAMGIEQNAITLSFLMELSSQSPTSAGRTGERA